MATAIAVSGLLKDFGTARTLDRLDLTVRTGSPRRGTPAEVCFRNGAARPQPVPDRSVRPDWPDWPDWPDRPDRPGWSGGYTEARS